ncbi:hypothetical protein P3T76_010093 [Phytophthora citrophthora]|uniref:Uncharacterized protein n=1 Tax=Phytophthora citrophthora TaxID=4793 RepID=A0AAD9GDY8_9STRA|nr:hypothetical protein P3T76_010093 [Phytophthora citrophthora]
MSSYCDYDEGDSFARKLFELENDELQLELSIDFIVLGKPCTVIYQFQLQPVSLQRIHTLEAKIRAVEEELAAQKARDTKKSAETV